MLQVEEAQKKILSSIHPLSSETVTLADALGRVLASNIISQIDLPPFDNSAMDGYAVVARDLREASATNPVNLRLLGRIAAGTVFDGEVKPGSCVRLFTGSPLPRGADAVVMQEDTRSVAETPQDVAILDAIKPWENIRLKGEDMKQGAILANAGEGMTTFRLSLLAAAGVSELRVGRKPAIGLMATGSELVDPGQPLGPGQIYESNRIGLSALVSQAGGKPKIFPIVKDNLEITRARLEHAFQNCDAVVTSGGVSVGEFDFVKSAFESLGGKLAFWKIAMKPGKPFVFGQWKEKLFFGLPGNPASALVTFLILVHPALRRLQGAVEIELPKHPGVLMENLVNRGDRRHFMRVNVSADGAVRSAGLQVSHALSSMAGANGLVDVPAETEWKAEQKVEVIRWL